MLMPQYYIGLQLLTRPSLDMEEIYTNHDKNHWNFLVFRRNLLVKIAVLLPTG